MSKLELMTNMVFLLADMLETNMLEMEQAMAKEGKKMRFDIKRNYLAALGGLRKFKREVDFISEKSQEDYDNDSEMMLSLLYLIVDRCGENDKKLYKIFQDIKLMKSELNLDFISDEAFIRVLKEAKHE